MKRKEKNVKKGSNGEEIRAIEKARREHPEIAKPLDILMKLTEISGDIIPVKGENINWDKLKEGFPVVDKRILPEDLGPLTKRFKEILNILLAGDNVGASAVSDFFEEKKLFKKLLEGVLTGQYSFPKKYSRSKPVTLFAAGETLLPLINDIKLSHPPKEGLDNWGESYCPICGAPPSISAIEGEENRLFLYCSRCAQSWNFPRLVCVHCGEEDQKKLQYFYAETDEIHRVYVCDSCKHYMKSVDKREKNVVFPRPEDLTTIRLDIVAKSEGYTRESIDFVGLILMDHKAEQERS